MASKSFVWALDKEGNPCKCYAAPENRGRGRCDHYCHADEGQDTNAAMKQLTHEQKKCDAYNKQIHINDHDKDHARTEKNILAAFPVGEQVNINGKKWMVKQAGLPEEQEAGNCKTDVYVKLVDENGKEKEYKFSIKQSNYLYIENHMRDQRIQSIFGVTGKDFSEAALKNQSDEWKARKAKTKLSKDETGLTIPFSYEYMLCRGDAKSSNDTQDLNNLPVSTLKNIYEGSNLSEGKRDTFIGPDLVKESGVANYYLLGDYADRVPSAEELVNKAEKLDDKFYKKHNSLKLQTKAVNIRLQEKDGKFYAHNLLGSQLSRRDIKYKDGKVDISNEIYATNPDYITQKVDGKEGWEGITGWHKEPNFISEGDKKWAEISEDSVIGKVIKENNVKSLKELQQFIVNS